LTIVARCGAYARWHLAKIPRGWQETEMFDHISIGIRDIARSKRFYDSALGPLGYRVLRESEGSLGYGVGKVSLWLLKTESPVPADPKSGLHFAFRAPNVRSVGEFYIAALESGGSDNGAPGERLEYAPGYYAAYVLDPDGYRLEAYHAEDEDADRPAHDGND
jgi:catechol 2,3-dioxygenase-like lactoylglutathione lyase family enzyme